MSVIDTLEKKAAETCPVIVFPEGGEEKIALAAEILAKKGICKPVILGDRDVVAGFGIDLDLVKVAAPSDYDAQIDEWAAAYEPIVEMPAKIVAKRLRKKPLALAAALVKFGDADGVIAGLANTTGEVVLQANMFIGLAEGVKLPSSYFLMEVPGWEGGEEGLVVFADCGLNVNPNSEELASIAITTADSVSNLLGWEPRVAMLSFSTKGSGKHDDANKVVEAYKMVVEQRPDLKVDGELQADSALCPDVAARKAGADNMLQGHANVLIFPDIDAGNISYKLVQRFAKGNAYGPMLQGFACPVSDLSRGSSVEDIVGVATILAAQV